MAKGKDKSPADMLERLSAAVPAVRPSEALQQRVLAALEPEAALGGFTERLATFFDLPPERIAELLATIGAAPASPWRASGLAGVVTLRCTGGARLDGAECGLVHIEPKHGLARHHHLGDEWGFLLQGRAQEDHGQVFQPGDLMFKPAGSEHAITVLGAEPCVFANVSKGGVEWIER